MPKATVEKKTKAGKTANKEAIKNSKVIAGADTTKAEKPSKKETPAKAEKSKPRENYQPQEGTMRFFVFKALQDKPATTAKIYERAAKIGAKAKAAKGATVEDYKGFGNINFFLNVLEERGFKVIRDGDKIGIEAR